MKLTVDDYVNIIADLKEEAMKQLSFDDFNELLGKCALLLENVDEFYNNTSR